MILSKIHIGIVDKIYNGRVASLRYDPSANLSDVFKHYNHFKIAEDFSDFSDDENDLYIYTRKAYKLISKKHIGAGLDIVNKHKVLVDREFIESGDGQKEVIGDCLVAGLNDVCNSEYVVAGVFDNCAGVVDSENMAFNYVSYLETKFVRYLISLVKTTDFISRSDVVLVPKIDVRIPWTDEMLYNRYGLTDEEILEIETKIKPKTR